MVRPPAKHQGRLVDVDFANFINEFLFNSRSDGISTPPTTTTSTPRYKGYRNMWRAAARAVIAKKRSTLSLKDPIVRSLPSHVSLAPPLCDRARAGATDDILPGGNCIVVDVDAPFSVTTAKDCSMDHTRYASCICMPPKHGSRKPPRPPRGEALHSSSYRSIRLKIARRRAMVESKGKNDQRNSSSNAAVICATITTICFVFIMLLQVFFGENAWHSLPSAGQQLKETVSLSPL